jgi:hypothetical protein
MITNLGMRTPRGEIVTLVQDVTSPEFGREIVAGVHEDVQIVVVEAAEMARILAWYIVTYGMST